MAIRGRSLSVHEAAMLSEGLSDPLVLTERPAKAMGEHSRRQLPAPVDADFRFRPRLRAA